MSREEGSREQGPLRVLWEALPWPRVYLQGFPVSTHLRAPTGCHAQQGCKEENHPAWQGAPGLTTHMPNKTQGRSEGQQERLGPRPVSLFPREVEGFLEEVALS